MDRRIKLSRTDVFLLVLTALFLLTAGAVYLLTPHTVREDYTVELARRIIDWRTANGPFASPEQLLEVDGIGQATLDGLRDHITTEEIQE